jgi:hypothetical protein
MPLMKLIAIGQRGSKRDFVDLACFLRKFPNVSLGGLLELLQRKYGSMYSAHSDTIAFRLRCIMDLYLQIWILQSFFASILVATHYLFIETAVGFTRLLQEKKPRDGAGRTCVPFWMQCIDVLGGSAR